MKAALQMFPDNTNFALRVAVEWPESEDVQSIAGELVEDDDGGLKHLPTKVELCRSVWNKAHLQETDTEDFTKLCKLYAELRTFIEKPGTQIQITNNSDNRKVAIANVANIAEAEKLYNEMTSGELE